MAEQSFTHARRVVRRKHCLPARVFADAFERDVVPRTKIIVQPTSVHTIASAPAAMTIPIIDFVMGDVG